MRRRGHFWRDEKGAKNAFNLDGFMTMAWNGKWLEMMILQLGWEEWLICCHLMLNDNHIFYDTLKMTKNNPEVGDANMVQGSEDDWSIVTYG